MAFWAYILHRADGSYVRSSPMTDPARPCAESVSVSRPRTALTPHGEEIMRACAAAVLGPLLPVEGAARETALAASMEHLDDYLACLSLPLQTQARFLFATLDLFPVRLLLLGTGRRWSALAPPRVAAFLRRARTSRFFLLRRVYVFLQSMSVVGWFDLPIAWHEVGYPGPPIERPTTPGVRE